MEQQQSKRHAMIASEHEALLGTWTGLRLGLGLGASCWGRGVCGLRSAPASVCRLAVWCVCVCVCV